MTSQCTRCHFLTSQNVVRALDFFQTHNAIRKVTARFIIHVIQILKTKLPPSEITVPALASENIPVSGEHRLVPLTIQTDGLHYGERVPATLTVVVEGPVQHGAERDPRLGPGLGAESLTPSHKDVLEEKRKIVSKQYIFILTKLLLISICVSNNI